MANKLLDVKIALRNDTGDNWSTKNPVLLKGEIGIVKDSTSDNNKFKIGDGVAAWNSLSFFNTEPFRVSANRALPGDGDTSQVLFIDIDGQLRTVSSLYIDQNGTLTLPASQALTGNPTAPTQPAGNSSTRIATTAFVTNAVSTAAGAVDAMRFKGTIGTGGTVTALPTTGRKVGDTYRVITAGTYAGQKCEVGDLIICISDSAAVNDSWTVAQTNIDGAVVSTRTIATSTGLSGGGDLSANRTLKLVAATVATLGGVIVSTGLTVDSYGAVRVSYGTAAETACQGNDSRLSNSRTPTGTAGGDLTGTYPNPTIGAKKVTAAKIADTTITDAKMAANSLNVAKLFIASGDTLILNGGVS